MPGVLYIVRMTPVELKDILGKLGISRGGFGLMLGATRRSGENWTDPDRGEVPGPVQTVAWLLDERPELLQLVIKRAERRKGEQ